MCTNEQLLAPLLKVWVLISANGMILFLLKESYKTVPARVVNRQYYSGLRAIADVAATIKARFYDIGIGVDFESNFKAWDKPVNPRVSKMYDVVPPILTELKQLFCSKYAPRDTCVIGIICLLSEAMKTIQIIIDTSLSAGKSCPGLIANDKSHDQLMISGLRTSV
ncbi:hypothetical protein Tco_0000876 [Tanacetum coccineum]